jgi:hypothetical protein
MDNDPGSISINSEDVRGLRALLEIANDKSCAEATRELARLGLTGYLSSILGEPPVIEDGGACDYRNRTRASAGHLRHGVELCRLPGRDRRQAERPLPSGSRQGRPCRTDGMLALT